jgi:HlyD family secretion protein
VADAYAAERFAARVLGIAPLVDAQRGAVEVKFNLLGDAPAFLREDMTLSVEVETARRERALALPLALLRESRGDSASVQVVVDGRVQARTLRLGLRTLAAVEVLEGLQPGEAVLIGPGYKPGQRVRVQPVDKLPVATRGDSGSAGSALTNAMGR